MLPNNKNLFEKYCSSLQKTGHSASQLVNAALFLWIESGYSHLKPPRVTSSLLKVPCIVEFSSWISKQDFMTGAFWLSSAYAALTGKTTRKENSLFFTPPFLSNRILDNAGKALLSGKVIDPACGGAAFLVPAAARIAKSLEDRKLASTQILEYLEKNLFGCDSDAFLCELSGFFLRMVLAGHIAKAGREPQFNIRHADGLHAFNNELGGFSLVLCNPPYKKLSEAEVVTYRGDYEGILKGQPNLYALFIRKAMTLLRQRGRAVVLTPMSFLSGRSFSKLRLRLGTEGHVCQLDMIHNKYGVFLGAEQDSVVTVWEKVQGKSTPAEIFTLTAGGNPHNVGKLELVKSETSWPIPRTSADTELLPLFSNMRHSLASYGFKPKTGIIVIHRDKRNRYKRLTRSSPAVLPIPLIWASDIGTDGTLRHNASGKNEANFVDMEAASHPSIIRTSAVAIQRVTAYAQKRRLICAPVPLEMYTKYGGVVGENHISLIVKISESSAISSEFLSDILRTEILDRLFRCISGATNVSAYELMQLPMPDPQIVIDAINKGYEVEDAVRKGFGLTTLINHQHTTKIISKNIANVRVNCVV